MTAIDLHAHSTVSDGTDTPAELVAAAAAAGLDVLAITDHDTTAGWAEAEAALAQHPTVTLVRGMEMSCTGVGEDGGPVPVHLLAYLFDPAHAVFAQERLRLRGERSVRLRAMAELMAADGLPVDPDAVLAGAGESAGRPHLARALVDGGVVKSVDEAFVSLLAHGGRYYVEKADTPLEDAVKLVNAAGGVSVVAHARARARGKLLSLRHIRSLAAMGLGGLEVAHPDHSNADRELLAGLAGELGLFMTGSSDYHGANKQQGLGECLTSPDDFAALVAKTTGVPVLSAGAVQ